MKFKSNVWVEGVQYQAGDECPPDLEEKVDPANLGEDDEDGTTGQEEGYSGMSVPELQGLLRERGLPVSGTKAELMQRLESDDNGSD